MRRGEAIRTLEDAIGKGFSTIRGYCVRTRECGSFCLMDNKLGGRHPSPEGSVFKELRGREARIHNADNNTYIIQPPKHPL
jgi:hypothetical protein